MQIQNMGNLMFFLAYFILGIQPSFRFSKKDVPYMHIQNIGNPFFFLNYFILRIQPSFRFSKKEVNADPKPIKSFLLCFLPIFFTCRKTEVPGWRARGPAVRAPACPSAASGTASQSPSTAAAAPAVTVPTQILIRRFQDEKYRN
jgi:hypothetical protein